MSIALFVRHGKASAFSDSGYDKLSEPGFEQSELLGVWLAEQDSSFDAVFVGPRKRHAETYEAVARIFSQKGRPLPPAVELAELDEHHGIDLVFKLLPQLALEDDTLRGIVETMMRGERPAADDLLSAFRRITGRWVRGEIGHDDVESWMGFRARVAAGMGRMAAIGRGKTALAFTSAGTIAAAVAESLSIRDEEKVLHLSFALYNGSMTELDFADERWGLRTFNATPHLRDKRLLTPV